MKSPRLTGRSEKFGPVTTSDEFLTWEIPDKESSSRMRSLLDSMGRASLVLDKTKYGGVTFDNKTHASFIEKQDFSQGRDESAHQVRFGQLLLNGRDLHEVPELVAVKPFEDRAALYREWAAHEYLNSLTDRQIGYINLGVHNDHKGVESIVSQYDHGVVTFDSSFWAGEDDPESATRPAVLQRHAMLGARALGFLHGVGMTHGDAQVKNLAADRLGFRAVDLESAEILDEEKLNDKIALTQTGRDISAFISSMGMADWNMGRISDAFHSVKIRDKVAHAYLNGAEEGHATIGGTSVPDFGALNQDRIHNELDKLAANKTDKKLLTF